MIICFGHEKGGVGKSSLACSFAARIAQMGHSVVIIDTDEVASSAGWYALREHNQVSPSIPVVLQPCRPENVILDMAGRYDAVIVDVGAADYDTMRSMAKICDLWVAPCLLSQNDVAAHIRFMDAMTQHGARHKSGAAIPIVTVLNRTPSAWNSTEARDVRDYLMENCPASKVLEFNIHDRKIWRDITRMGVGISEVSGKSHESAVSEFNAVFDEALSHQYVPE